MDEPSRRILTCEAVKPRISAYVDRELPEPLAREIEKHLAVCEACHREELSFRALWEALEDNLSVQAPITLKESVLRRIEEEERDSVPNFALLRRFFPISAAVATLCLIAGGFLGRTMMEKEAAKSGQLSVAETLDIFTPAPRGTLANSYFAMVQNPER